MKRLLLVCVMILWLVLLSGWAEETGTQCPEPDFVYSQAEEKLAEIGLEKIDHLNADAFLNSTRVYLFLCRNTRTDSLNPSGYAIQYLAWAPESGVIPLDILYLPEQQSGAWVVPDADRVRTLVFERIAALPAGTAGSSLQQAEAVASLWMAALEYRFDQMDPAALRTLMREAWDAVPAEEQADFAQKAPAVLAEAHRLLDPSEQPGGLYEDTGTALIINCLREDPAVCSSMEALLAGMEAAAEFTEPGDLEER